MKFIALFEMAVCARFHKNFKKKVCKCSQQIAHAFKRLKNKYLSCYTF